MDVGKDIRRRRTGSITKMLANVVPENMQEWTIDNFDKYVETMELIREGAPVQWARLYHDAVKMGLDKNVNVNVNISREQDRINLQALVKARVPALDNNGAYTPYEEVREKQENKITR